MGRMFLLKFVQEPLGLGGESIPYSTFCSFRACMFVYNENADA